jgi:hypothetical protein
MVFGASCHSSGRGSVPREDMLWLNKRSVGSFLKLQRHSHFPYRAQSIAYPEQSRLQRACSSVIVSRDGLEWFVSSSSARICSWAVGDMSEQVSSHSTFAAYPAKYGACDARSGRRVDEALWLRASPLLIRPVCACSRRMCEDARSGAVALRAKCSSRCRRSAAALVKRLESCSVISVGALELMDGRRTDLPR